MALNTDHLYFKGVQNIGDSHVTDRLETSLYFWLNWAFLEVGAFYNVEIPTSGVFGGDFSKLRAVSDPSYTARTVFEAPRQDFVYETGIAYTGGTPIQISGVYINDVFYEPDDATYGHYVDYPRGRVIFDSAVPTSATVKMNYSYRGVQTYIVGNAPWWREAMFDSQRVDNSTFTQLGSGLWSIGSNHRVQMPAIIIESVPLRRTKPYELGSGSLWLYQAVNFDILAENKWDRDKLMDILSTQADRTVVVFDPDDISYPLDYRGVYQSGSDMYPDYVQPINDNLIPGQKARWKDAQIIQMDAPHPNLYTARVRITMEMPFGTV